MSKEHIMESKRLKQGNLYPLMDDRPSMVSIKSINYVLPFTNQFTGHNVYLCSWVSNTVSQQRSLIICQLRLTVVPDQYSLLRLGPETGNTLAVGLSRPRARLRRWLRHSGRRWFRSGLLSPRIWSLPHLRSGARCQVHQDEPGVLYCERTFLCISLFIR